MIYLFYFEGRKNNKLKSQSKAQSKLPDLRNHEEAQAFFLHEVINVT